MVGLGELLARLERRRQLLAAEGLFAAELKRRLPFLPGTVGLVTAPSSAAERDVLENARRRWPGGRLRGGARRDAGPARGRRGDRGARRASTATPTSTSSWSPAAAARWRTCCRSPTRPWSAPCTRARTPVVSAIGHEPDSPLLDLVADVRASTPTDAAKLVVPDVAEELRLVDCRPRTGSACAPRLADPRAGRARRACGPARCWPTRAACSTPVRDEVAELRDRARRTLGHGSTAPRDDIDHQRARVRALSPLATLQRGYAVLQDADGPRRLLASPRSRPARPQHPPRRRPRPRHHDRPAPRAAHPIRTETDTEDNHARARSSPTRRPATS